MLVDSSSVVVWKILAFLSTVCICLFNLGVHKWPTWDLVSAKSWCGMGPQLIHNDLCASWHNDYVSKGVSCQNILLFLIYLTSNWINSFAFNLIIFQNISLGIGKAACKAPSHLHENCNSSFRLPFMLKLMVYFTSYMHTIQNCILCNAPKSNHKVALVAC